MWNWMARNRAPLAYLVLLGAGLLILLGPAAAILVLLIAIAAGLVDHAPGLPAFIWRAAPHLALLIAMLTVAFLPEATDRTGSKAFFSASAQIIPVLLLAVTFQLRLVRRNRPFEMRLAIVSISLLALGEFYALQSLERGHGGSQQFGFVVAAMAYGFLALALHAVGSPPDDEADQV